MAEQHRYESLMEVVASLSRTPPYISASKAYARVAYRVAVSEYLQGISNKKKRTWKVVFYNNAANSTLFYLLAPSFNAALALKRTLTALMALIEMGFAPEESFSALGEISTSGRLPVLEMIRRTTKLLKSRQC